MDKDTKKIIDPSNRFLQKPQTRSATIVQEILFLSKSCTYTWSPSITDNPLIVTNVVQFLRGKTAYIDIKIQVMVHMVCKYCGKQFVKKRNLQTHIQGAHEVNANEQSKCEVCSKHLEDEDNYKKHNECIKACKFCPERFCTSRAMDAHMNSKHTFFHCEFCGQEFSNESNLSRHLRMCTSKPKTCKSCGSLFCNLGTLIMDHS